MSRENLEWLREVSEARAREDTEAVEALLRVGLAAEFELQPLYPDRVYRGAEGMRELWTDAVETWEDYRFETEEIIDLGEHVLVLAHITGRGTGSGVPIDQRIGILVAFEGEKAVWADSFTWDAHARPLTNFQGDTAAGDGGLWTATPEYDWAQSPPGSAVSYLTSRLSSNTTVIGAGAVEAWVRSSAPNVDLQATITEVRPDGKETFVQGGWVRANERQLDAAKSTLLEPVLSLREADVSPMPPDRYVKVTIPLYYEGHAYRAGSRIRVTVSAPNGDQPIWSFGETEPSGTATVSIAHSKQMPSRLLLPVVPGVSVPTGLPPCPGLRGEPCRDYQALVNRTATP